MTLGIQTTKLEEIKENIKNSFNYNEAKEYCPENAGFDPRIILLVEETKEGGKNILEKINKMLFKN